jgi:hypothetical protein
MAKSFTVLKMLGLALLVPVLKTLFAGDPLSYMYPNFLLFTLFREVAKDAWKQVLHVDTAVQRAPTQIPSIQAEDYSFESLRAATDNFRHPAVVRGFFKGTKAAEKWTDPEYLNSRIGDFSIPVVMRAEYNTGQNQRELMKFSDAFNDIMQDPESKKYLFFPVKSRENFNHSSAGKAEELKKKVDEIIVEDLELDRIWKGFGGPNHRTFFGGQFVIGRGSNDSDATTGTGWHCAAGNNWFAQVTGTKRWYFMDPEYSAYMSPLKGGLVNMQTSHKDMHKIMGNIPIRYSDIHAGDLLYNPDWEWHTIKNYAGLAIGVPIRELNISLSLRNNFQYTSIVALNKIADRFGLSMGGFGPSV